jgi:hypothetical protein
MCFYGIYLLGYILFNIIVSKDLVNATFIDSLGNRLKSSKIIIVQYLLSKHFMLMSLLLLAICMGLCIFCFLLYHIYLISLNQTTNESSKLSDLKYALEDSRAEISENNNDKQTVKDQEPESNNRKLRNRKLKNSQGQGSTENEEIRLSKESLQVSKTFYNLGFSKNMYDSLFRF